MRLWDIDIIKYLPRTQLLAQWRELNSIYKKQDKHILINYIYGYSKEYLLYYSKIVINEMERRDYKIQKWTSYNKYFENISIPTKQILRYNEHNIEYKTICYYNLLEKYRRGQADMDTNWRYGIMQFAYIYIKGDKIC